MQLGDPSKNTWSTILKKPQLLQHKTLKYPVLGSRKVFLPSWSGIGRHYFFTSWYIYHVQEWAEELLFRITENRIQYQFSSVQSLSHVRLFATPWTTAHQSSLSITNSWSLLKLTSIKLVMPSNHLILCRPLLFPPSIFPSIRVFSNESVLHIRWPKYWRSQLQHQSFQWIFRTDFP